MAKSSKKSSKKESPKKKMSGARKAMIVCVCALVVVFGCCCVAFAAVEESRAQYVPETTMLDGQVDVSGMTADELRALLEKRVENNVATTIILTAGDRAHTIEMAEIGTIDIDATVAQAFAPYHDNPVMRFVSTVGELVTGEPAGHDICTVCVVDREALQGRIAALAQEANVEPKNAGYAYDKDTHALVVAPAQQGVVMDEAETETVARIERALASPTNGDPDRLKIEAQASVTDAESDEPGQGIFVDLRNCRVNLYEDGHQVMSYACAPGMSGYDTPRGDFYLSYKDAAPTWYNPHSAWSEGMEETIGPGPNNPLGLRALAVSCGGGIFIHGTESLGSLGSPASHGCIRIANKNIVELYDRVSAGIPIIIR